MFCCPLCLNDGRRTPDAWLPGYGAVCWECVVALWRNAEPLCAICGYWVATVGPLCEACATDRTNKHSAEQT